MKADFSSLNNKVNSHAAAIKILEGQLSLLSAQLKPKMTKEYDDRGLATVTRSGKVAIGNVTGNEEAQIHEEDKGREEEEIPIHQSIAKGPQNYVDKHNPIPKVMQPLTKISPQFPQSLQKKNEDEKFKKFLSVFKTLLINLPLVEALFEMLGYAKFKKELVKMKRILDFETIEVSQICSTIMIKELIKNREDPEAFTIPYTIGILQFVKALCDLGASINLMPYVIYKQLGLGEPKAITMRLLMADQSIKHPVGILYDILVKVDRFIFTTDFVILDCKIDAEIPIILGRPFLATGRALVDVESEELKFRVNEDELTFNVCKSMKHPSDSHVVSSVDVIDEVVASVSHLMCMSEPLEAVLATYDEFEIQGCKEVKLLHEVLRKHIKAIGWTIAGLVGIPLGICTNKIQPDSEDKPSVEHQRRLNPSMQEMVKK
ncbi:uncharacterized protein [Solanum tuberosum]|uniref:uncharacterized protein n=1 Tax=Solanum tuberosum TaxID=4113 RepID=UPI00073A108F|nr:PREDICTED: uncharacterized protein LOC107060423 [Solanum tuberosum]